MQLNFSIFRLFCFIGVLLAGKNIVKAQTPNNRLLFKDASTGVNIGYVSIYIDNNIWRISDANGNLFFDSIANEIVCIKTLGYQDTCINLLAVLQTKKGIIELTKRAFQLKEVSIYAAYNNLNSLDVKYTNSINQNQIKAISQLASEPDLIKSLQLLPGVNRGLDGSADLVVRGGNPDQNLILIDGIPVYNINHFAGMFSSIPVSGVEEAQFYTGGFPAQYGGRLSSIVDVRLKEGSFTKWRSDRSYGLIAMRGYIDGPIIKNKLSITLNVRQTWIDLIASALYSKQEMDQVYIGFGDYYGKLSWKIKPNQHLNAFFFTARDRYVNAKFNSSINTRWNNRVLGLSHHYIQGKLKQTSTLAISGYQFGNEENMEIKNVNTVIYRSNDLYFFRLSDFYVQHQLDYYHNNSFKMHMGSQYRRHFASMPQFTIRETRYDNNGNLESEINSETNNPNRNLDEISVFGQAYYNFDKTSLGVGVRTGLFFGSAGTTPYIDPRINIKHNFNHRSQFSVAFDMNHQSLHELRLNRISLATDYLFPMGNDFGLSRSLQLEARYQYQIFKNGMVGTAVFNKNFWNLSERAEGLGILYSENPSSLLVNAIGNVYGVETFANYSADRLFAQLSYSYNQAFRQSDELNRGEKFLSDFNNTHHFKTNFSVSIAPRKNRKRELGLAWYYVKGVPYTVPSHFLPNPFYSYPRTESVAIGKNSQFLPDWHRLDFNYKNTKIKKNGRKQIFELNILNVYNRKNIFFLKEDIIGGFDRRYGAFALALFGIFPTFSFSYEF